LLQPPKLDFAIFHTVEYRLIPHRAGFFIGYLVPDQMAQYEEKS
jgi:hypothetical protein